MKLREQGSNLYPGCKVFRLTVLGHQWRDGKYWRCVCECECGHIVCVITHCVGKSTLSCGCLQKEIAAATAKNPAIIAGRTYDAAKRRRTRSEIECLTCHKMFYPPDRKTKRCSKECRFASGNYHHGGRPHQCEQCGEPFINSRVNARFCSKSCYDINQTTAERRESLCDRCGKLFVAKADHGRWPRFCSRECFCATQNPPKTCDCNHCGKPFLAKYRKQRVEYERFCSSVCSAAASKTGEFVTCVICGKEVWTERLKLDRNNNRYCSLECRDKKSTDLCGESWNGGVHRHGSSNGTEYEMVAINRRDVSRPGHKTFLSYKARYRLVVEEYIGRKLTSDEPVWHINRNMTDDRIENLYVFETMAEMWRAIAKTNFPETSNLKLLRLHQNRCHDELGHSASDEDRSRLLRKDVEEAMT